MKLNGCAMDWVERWTAHRGLTEHHWPMSALVPRNGKMDIRFWGPIPEAREGRNASDVTSGVGEDNAPLIAVRGSP